MAYTRVTDHVELALASLAQQFQDKEKIRALLTSYVERLQQCEDVLYDLMTKRQIDTAEGEQLDKLGGIVGEARQGRTDDDYRRFVRARISVNKSNGTAQDVLTVTTLVLDDDAAVLNLQNSGPATAVLKIESVAVTEDVATILISFLRDTVAGGVRIVLEYGTELPANWANFDVDTFDTAGDVFVTQID